MKIRLPLFFILLLVYGCTGGPWEEIIPVRGITGQMWDSWLLESETLDDTRHRRSYGRGINYIKTGNRRPLGGVVSHHHLVGPLFHLYFKRLSRECDGVQTVIIIGPDHFLRTRRGIAIGTKDYSWEEEIVGVRKKTARKWISHLGITENTFPFYYEHSIHTLVPFISRYLPGASILPVIIRFDCDMGLLNNLIPLVRGYMEKNRKVLLLISTDFSHSLSREETARADRKSMETVVNMLQGYPLGLTCDSLNSWYVALEVFNGIKKETKVIFHTDSEHYLGRKTGDITSYFFSIIYERN